MIVKNRPRRPGGVAVAREGRGKGGLPTEQSAREPLQGLVSETKLIVNGKEVDAVSDETYRKSLESILEQMLRRGKDERDTGIVRLSEVTFDVARHIHANPDEPIYVHGVSKALGRPAQSVSDALDRLVTARLLKPAGLVTTPNGPARMEFTVEDQEGLAKTLQSEAIRRLKLAIDAGGFLPEDVGMLIASYFAGESRISLVDRVSEGP